MSIADIPRKYLNKMTIVKLFRILKYKLLGLFKLRNYRKFKNDIILVYTPGKVGSSTVLETLKYNFPFNKVYQAHYLNAEYIEKMSKYGMHRQRKIVKLLNEKKYNKLRIITLVREPISQSISELFQNINKDHKIADVQKMKYEDVLHEYNNMPKTYRWFEAEDWFDLEFKKTIGVDVYDYPFDKGKGYQIISEANTEILTIPLENLNRVFMESVSKFLDFKIKKVIKVNESKDKPLNDKYVEFKNSYKLGSPELDKKFSSKYVTHFFTEAQIGGFKDKWRRGSDD